MRSAPKLSMESSSDVLRLSSCWACRSTNQYRGVSR
jgi:hypothetical protein